MARRIKGGIKRSKTDPASNQFPKCSPPSGTHSDSESWVEKIRGREEIESRRPGGEKGESKGGESSQESPKGREKSRSQVKMGTEDWVVKGTKFITNTKKQRLKI